MAALYLLLALPTLRAVSLPEGSVFAPGRLHSAWEGDNPLAHKERNLTNHIEPSRSSRFISLASLSPQGSSKCPLPHSVDGSGAANAMIDKTYDMVMSRLPFFVAPPGSTENVAVLIEPRAEPCLLPYVVKNVMHFLGPGWQLQIFHGTLNLEHVKKQLSASPEASKISFVNVGKDNFADSREYSRYVASLEFWNQVQGENVLMFQLDSLLLRHGIEEYMAYDYVGAPWVYCDLPPEGDQDHTFYKTGPGSWCWMGGNGGLSFRKKSAMLKVLLQFPYPDGFPPVPAELQKGTLPEWIYQTYPEDVYFAINLPKVGGRMPERESAARFAVESIMSDQPLGVHSAWKYVSPEMEDVLFSMLRYEVDNGAEENPQPAGVPSGFTPPAPLPNSPTDPAGTGGAVNPGDQGWMPGVQSSAIQQLASQSPSKPAENASAVTAKGPLMSEPEDRNALQAPLAEAQIQANAATVIQANAVPSRPTNSSRHTGTEQKAAAPANIPNSAQESSEAEA